MEDWLRLIDAETEDDLMAIQQTTQIPEVRETIVKLRRLSVDEKIRQEAYYREKRLLDEATALGHARREGFAQGMEKGIAQGIEKGIAQGMEKGIEQRDHELAAKWRRMGMSEEQIQMLLKE